MSAGKALHAGEAPGIAIWLGKVCLCLVLTGAILGSQFSPKGSLRKLAPAGVSLTLDGHALQALYRFWCSILYAWAGVFYEFAMLAAQVDFMQNG